MPNYKRTPIKYQDPNLRIKNFSEVCEGYTDDEAKIEAKRCLDCKKPLCISGCPVNIDIPGFIREIKNENLDESFRILKEYNVLPAICGRVCPQEEQCELKCVLNKKNGAIAIGKLERYVADFARKKDFRDQKKSKKKNKKVAIIGSGPSSLTCGFELIKKGYDVCIFESLHKPGGVLTYGIPEFRLPKEIVDYEIKNIEEMGAEIKTDVFFGNTLTLAELKEENFEAIFLGIGAGLPKFKNIKGENLNGVFSANEFLTRNNLMKAYDERYATPIKKFKNVLVIGGGNVAMDAARCARRLGSHVYIAYRKNKENLPARIEEVKNAEEEGIKFLYQKNLIEIQGNGKVEKAVLVDTEIKKIDEKEKAIDIPGTETEIVVDGIVIAIGNLPNPSIKRAIPNLKLNPDGTIKTDEKLKTSIEGIYAGGDIVTGAATVIAAMGEGKIAAESIDEYLKK